MTKEEKLTNLSNVEKKLRKMELEGYTLLAELKAASGYKGLSQEWAENAFSSFVKWADSELSTKREWVHKYDN